ncbi:helix-turn-helix transcriptional regulator [Streptomyces microflavus]|uniref:helix-turn-helix transcriptional regulator n=1 Tax=Streptomyces microflavus TaxID=1919 RepID=UPI0033E3F407
MISPPLPVPAPAPGADEGDATWQDLLQRAAGLLARQRRLVVTGAWGSGKTTLLDTLARAATAEGWRCLYIRARPEDSRLAYGAVAQLFEPPSEAPLAVRSAVARLLADDRPTLLLVDGAEWVDPESVDALSYVLRSVDGLTVVASERTTAFPHAADRLLGGHAPVLAVRPLTVTDAAALLSLSSLPARWAGPVHRYCGGHRALLAAYLDATAADPPLGHGPPRWPAEVQDRAHAWLQTVPEPVRATVRAASLTQRLDLTVLRNAGHPEAEEHLEQALAAGLLTLRDPAGRTKPHPAGDLAFAAGAVAAAAAATGSAGLRAALQLALADAVPDPVQRARHRALAQGTADRGVAEDTADAAEIARQDGDRRLAAELMLLAAGLTPADRPRLRLARLARGAHDAAAAGCADLAQQAADAITAGRGSAAQRVSALLAVVDAYGQDMAGLESRLAEARRLAGDDPGLLAAVALRAAIRANLGEGRAAEALHHSGVAASLAGQDGDAALRASTLTMRARMERLTGGHDQAERSLREAVALGVPPELIGIRNSPEYLTARHALFDDRLGCARERFLALLSSAKKAGEAEDLVDLWRSLAETDTRLGSCATALDWSGRALELTASAGLSPGPAWYTAALVHSHGGSFSRAARYAEQAVVTSREEHDSIHTARGLWVLGSVRLHTGDAEGAADALAEVAALEDGADCADPGILRWQADAVEAFAAARRLDDAHALLDTLHPVVGTHGRHAGLRAALTRARAVCLRAEGSPDEAAELLEDAARLFAALAMPVEEGRTRLALGRLERGRRRQAAARAAWRRADSVFREAEAVPWLALTTAAVERLTGGREAAPQVRTEVLSAGERTLAALVRDGAGNREAAARMFLSVKTVESMLSRIYRKTGVHTRTQLLNRLAQEPEQPAPPVPDQP